MLHNRLHYVPFAGGIRLRVLLHQFDKIIGSDATEVCLFLAMKYGTSEIVCKLLQLGVFIHGASLYGRTSLHMAAFHGRSEIIHHLIGAGLDSTVTDAFGKTAVHYARENEYFEAARWCWLGRWIQPNTFWESMWDKWRWTTNDQAGGSTVHKVASR